MSTGLRRMEQGSQDGNGLGPRPAPMDRAGLRISRLRQAVRELRYLIARHIFRRNYLTAHAAILNLRFKFRIEDAGGRQIYKRGIYEEDLTQFLLTTLPNIVGTSGLVLDVGANLGWYSVILEKALPAGVRVLALEPDPDNFDLLQSNLQLNACTRVLALRVAASDFDGEKVLYLYPKKNAGRHSLPPINAIAGPLVHSKPLDLLLSAEGFDAQNVKFVKIDIEGYELVALRGMSSILQRCPLILAEYSPQFMRRGGLEPGDLVSLLEDRGFRPHLLSNGRLVKTDRPSLLSATHNLNVFWART